MCEYVTDKIQNSMFLPLMEKAFMEAKGEGTKTSHWFRYDKVFYPLLSGIPQEQKYF